MPRVALSAARIAATRLFLMFGIVLHGCVHSDPLPTTAAHPSPPQELEPCPSSPNCVASTATGEDHRVLPFALKARPDATAASLRAAVAREGGRVVADAPGYLHAEFTSSFWRFVDDFEALYGPGSASVAVRSASRVGYSDFGVNRARVERLRTYYQDSK